MTSGGGARVRVYVGRTLIEAELCVSFLRSEGVAAVLEDRATARALHGMIEAFDPGGGPGVLVPPQEEARARELVAAFDAPPGKVEDTAEA